ncbi:hypothetical protein KEU06_01685 [Pseudaminobacter sp. 19-2017]|uniref:Nutrient deprivation-induced protein n=1 Tax=Pseudaminobacter soli (ex Zhang et al. 2022) TaxID=2831468 RepID=A0A942DYI3_9HYPH|nr:hypothetical protein [Pseudaminobacter soli]MBS3647335.1 hypothetical protein [Pseudaminobacter soli]
MSNEDTGWRPGGPSGPGRQDPAGSHSGAKSTSDNAKEAISDAAHTVSDSAKDAAQSARDKAEEFAEHGKEAGANRIEGFAQVARNTADDLEKQSPEIAGYVRQAADGLERAASSVRGRSVGEFVDMVDDFARRQPAAFFGSAVLAGFVLSRFIKSRTVQSYANAGQDRSYGGAGARRGEQAGSRAMAEGLRQTGTETRYGSGGVGQTMPSTPSSIGEMP